MANVYQQCYSARRSSSSSDNEDYEHPLPVSLNSGATNYHTHVQVSASAGQNRANRPFNESSDSVVVNDNQDLARTETNDRCIDDKSSPDDLAMMPSYTNCHAMVSLNYNALKFHSRSKDSFDTGDGTLTVQRNESRVTKNRLSLLAAEHKNKREFHKHNSGYENIDKSESSTNGCENLTPQSHSHELVVMQINEQLATSTYDIGGAYEVSYSE